VRQDADVVLKFLELVISRLAHIETLLMGLATVGVAGWGFIHSTDYLNPDEPGAVLFAILFSGLIASAYSMLYVARMALNVVLLGLEKDLGGPVNPYRGYFQAVGKVRARLVYYLTACFVPFLALGSLIVVETHWLTKDVSGLILFRILLGLVAICVLVAVSTCIQYIEKTMFRMADLGLTKTSKEAS
jgi:hypothetical protein